MILFPEKGAIFRELDVKRQVKNHIRWSGNNEISLQEAQTWTFSNFTWMFLQTEGDYNFSSSSRGRGNLSSTADPYFPFPQIYNFRYNIYPSEWPAADRATKLYLQKKSENEGWGRQINGFSNNEKANLLLEKHTFKELLADVEQRNLQNNIVGLGASRLFARSEIDMGVDVFRDSLYVMSKRNTFLNIKFENTPNTLGEMSRTDLYSHLREWKQLTPLPFYSTGEPELTKVINKGREEFFILKILVSNNSGYDGITQMNVLQNGRWY